jgi:hypothetical protein
MVVHYFLNPFLAEYLSCYLPATICWVLIDKHERLGYVRLGSKYQNSGGQITGKISWFSIHKSSSVSTRA